MSSCRAALSHVVVAAFLVVLGLSSSGREARSAVPGEYQVKAVFLFNFAHFVEWPPEAFDDPGAPFVIGILGMDPFGTALEEAVAGEMIHGRRFVVERYATLAELKDSHILFIDRSARDELGRALEMVQARPTLTVADFESDDPREVVIRLMDENRRIRLRINVDAARTARLTISSKLLRPAQVVGSVGAG